MPVQHWSKRWLMITGKCVCAPPAALGRLRYVPALDALIETLGHRISNLRKEAALGVGRIK
jgi:hypothetical protein